MNKKEAEAIEVFILDIESKIKFLKLYVKEHEEK